MDLETFAVGTICVAICIMPFIYSGWSRKKKEKQFLQSLRHLAIEHDCELTQHEICGNYAIGMDQEKNWVFFQVWAGGELKQESVNLANIKDCRVTTFSTSKQGNNTAIDRLELHLIPSEKGGREIALAFYDSELSYQFTGELQSIDKWKRLISNHLTGGHATTPVNTVLNRQ